VQHLPINVSVLICGVHGIGKSSLARQVTEMISKKEGVEYTLIDRRLSQFTEGDMLGLPSIKGMDDEGVTRFNPPEWYMLACKQPCVLFFDELNRATHEVMQASFQVVLDRELAGVKLHPLTRVMSAVNTGSTYSVNEMDPALVSRFWCIDLDPDVEDWLAWAKGVGNISPMIIDFINGGRSWLDPQKGTQMTGAHPTRRAWERLDATLKNANCIDNGGHELFYPLAAGFIGTEAAIALQTFANDKYARIAPEDILEKYIASGKKKATGISTQERVVRLPIDRQAALIDSVAEYVIDHWKLEEDGKTFATKWEDKNGKHLKAFMNDLSDELKLSLWTKITDLGIENIPLLRVIHKLVVDDILWVYGMKANDPNSKHKVPDFIQKKLDAEAAAAAEPIAESAE
jgi:hypothetical protein